MTTVPWLDSEVVRLIWPRVVFLISLVTVVWCNIKGSLVSTKEVVTREGERQIWMLGLPTRNAAVMIVICASVLDIIMVLTEARLLPGLALLVVAAGSFIWLIMEENI
eukprot:gene5128-8779_t